MKKRESLKRIQIKLKKVYSETNRRRIYERKLNQQSVNKEDNNDKERSNIIRYKE